MGRFSDRKTKTQKRSSSPLPFMHESKWLRGDYNELRNSLGLDVIKTHIDNLNKNKAEKNQNLLTEINHNMESEYAYNEIDPDQESQSDNMYNLSVCGDNIDNPDSHKQVKMEDSTDLPKSNNNDTSSNNSKKKRTVKQFQRMRINNRFSKEDKMKAVDLAKISNPSKAAKELGISRKNIVRWMNNGTSRKEGAGRKVKFINAEREMIQWVIDYIIKHGTMPRNVSALEQAKKIEEDNFKASKGWYDKFLKRNSKTFQEILDDLNHGYFA